MKHAPPESIKQRTIPADVVGAVSKELRNMEPEVKAVEMEEREEKEVSSQALTPVRLRDTATDRPGPGDAVPEGQHGAAEGEQHARVCGRDQVPTSTNMVPVADREGRFEECAKASSAKFGTETTAY